MKTHFGPEDPRPEKFINRHRDSIDIVKNELEDQMVHKTKKKALTQEVAHLEEVRAQQINNIVVEQDKAIIREKDRHLKELLKTAWDEQINIKKATDRASNKHYRLTV